MQTDVYTQIYHPNTHTPICILGSYYTKQQINDIVHIHTISKTPKPIITFQ
jgi:hypothetical protein